MKVSELIKKLQKCDDTNDVIIIQQETLECLDEYWDNECFKLRGNAVELMCVDLHSHGFYLIATPNGHDFIC